MGSGPRSCKGAGRGRRGSESDMDDPATCTALVLYAGDDEDPPAAQDGSMARRGTASGAGGVAEGVAGTAATAGAGSGTQKTTADSAAAAGAPAAVPRFVGLSNQGATCYMNSLLQTLYMTPEVGPWVDERLYMSTGGLSYVFLGGYV